MRLTNDLSIEQYRGKRVLVTGSSGYLANNLIHFLKDVGCHITRLSRTGAILSLFEGKSQVTDMVADITLERTWLQVLPNIDIVFHFAAQTSIAKANEDPIVDRDHNVLPLLRLLECCRKQHWKPTVLLASTVCIYGLVDQLPVDENFPDQPHTMYELHKLQCEQYLKLYAQQGYVNGASLRLANVYGPGVQCSSGDRGVLNQMVKRALKQEPLTVYGEGNFLRDYVYIDDVTRAFLSAGLLPEKINQQQFIIASGQAYTVKEAINMVAKQVQAQTGIQTTINHVAPPATMSLIDTRNFEGRIQKFNTATGWEPQINFEEGIDLTIKAML